MPTPAFRPRLDPTKPKGILSGGLAQPQPQPGAISPLGGKSLDNSLAEHPLMQFKPPYYGQGNGSGTMPISPHNARAAGFSPEPNYYRVPPGYHIYDPNDVRGQGTGSGLLSPLSGKPPAYQFGMETYSPDLHAKDPRYAMPSTGGNTPQMLEASRQLYGGAMPGAGRGSVLGGGVAMPGLQSGSPMAAFGAGGMGPGVALGPQPESPDYRQRQMESTANLALAGYPRIEPGLPSMGQPMRPLGGSLAMNQGDYVKQQLAQRAGSTASIGGKMGPGYQSEFGQPGSVPSMLNAPTQQQIMEHGRGLPGTGLGRVPTDRIGSNPIAMTARGPVFSGPAQGAAGMIPNPNAVPPQPYSASPGLTTASGRAKPYDAGKGYLSPRERQDLVRSNAMARSDSRRLRMGNLNIEERLKLGMPGYATTGLRESGATDRARLADAGMTQRAGIADTGMTTRTGMETGSREKIANTAKESALGVAGTNLRASRSRDRALTGIEDKRQAGSLAVSKQQGENLKGVAQAQRDPLNEKRFEVEKRNSDLALADAYRQKAQQAAESGDMEEYNRHMATANSLVPQIPGGPPSPLGGGSSASITARPSWSNLPLAARQSLRGSSPQEMVRNIQERFPNATREEANAMIQAAYPGQASTMLHPEGTGLGSAIWNATLPGAIMENMKRIRNPKAAPKIPWTNIPRPASPADLIFHP